MIGEVDMIMRIIAFILTNIMATTLVFAEHTKANFNSDLSRVFDAYSSITQGARNKSNQCSNSQTNKLVRKIDSRIEKARLSNETIEDSLKKELIRYEKVRRAQIRMTKRILKRNRRINRTYRKVKKSNPKLTFVDYVKELKASVTTKRTEQRIASITETLLEAGSMENYLVDMKDRILRCDFSKVDGSGFDIGWVWVILFVGLPILTLITSLFAIIFGAFWWALGLFAYSVIGLLILFTWGNISLNRSSDDQEEVFN